MTTIKDDDIVLGGCFFGVVFATAFWAVVVAAMIIVKWLFFG